MKIAVTAARLLIVMTILTGVAYPLLITAAGKIFFANKAEGSLIMRHDSIIGSELIGQGFASLRYFWPRPSVISFNPMPSSGSNLGPTSADLKKAIADRRDSLQVAHGQEMNIPVDLLCASGSGLDPHISPAAARYQVERVATSRGLDATAKNSLLLLIDTHTELPTLGLLGEPRVNVLKLNLAVDSMTEAQNNGGTSSTESR